MESRGRYKIFSAQARQCPHEFYENLRPEGPVIWNPSLGFWMVLGYDEARACLTDHEHCSSALRPGAASLFGATSMIFSDRPEHMVLRNHLSPLFGRQALEPWRGFIEQTAAELWSAAVHAASSGVVDVIQAVASPLPVFVICEMMGIPAEDREHLRDLSHAVVSLGHDDTNPARRKSAARTLQQYFRGLLLRDPPATTPLFQAISSLPAVAGDALDERVATCVMLLVAGHETTSNLLGNLTVRIARDGWLSRLQSDEALAKRFLNEAMRVDGSVQYLRRVVSKDCMLGGMALVKGTTVLIMLDAANLDSASFPQSFDVEREQRTSAPPNLTFGAGIHHCLGSNLARIEIDAYIRQLVAQVADIELLTDPPRYIASFFARGPKSLPIRLAQR